MDSKLPGELAISAHSLRIRVESREEAINILNEQSDRLMLSAKRLGLWEAQIFWDGCRKPLRLLASSSSESEPINTSDLIEQLEQPAPDTDREVFTALEQLLFSEDLPQGLCEMESDTMIYANEALARLAGKSKKVVSTRNVRSLWQISSDSIASLLEIKRNLRQQKSLFNHPYLADLNPGEPCRFRSDFQAIYLPNRAKWVRLATLHEVQRLGRPVMSS
ncbi:MAG: hypothetical protein LRZ84_07615 [Desertifilum sp.]|nr:hypothetical protein [Desertifilum sp.]